ncbi:hypothetical protein M422DRAFT_24891 [Sphaerobolus stellatus SS14]|nr:hypothetical protein M422DRAFT_24891 [Sphaerobolus stellatus SS14]
MDQITKNPLFLAAVALGLLFLYKLFTKRLPAPYPPGPKGFPLLGNAFDFPLQYPYLTFAKWGKQYGGITYAKVLGLNFVILNESKYAVEMLEKKGKIYSDRPRFMMAGELVGWSESPALSQAGPTWAEHRKQMAAFMGSRQKIEAFSDILQKETGVVLKKLLNHGSQDFVKYFRGYAGATSLAINYGYRAKDETDPMLSLAGLAMEHFSEMIVANAFAVDTFPILRHVPSWLPGAGWKKKAIRYRNVLSDMVEKPYHWVKQQIATGMVPQAFVTQILIEKELDPREERIAQWTAAGCYAGMADTTSAGTAAFMLAMTRHTPELLKAQEEIDAVIGTGRLPTPADRANLPYFEGLYLEVFRLYSFGPLGVPHVNREDDIHDGYFIPKGSIVIANGWQFNRDPETYPNPEVFSPERYSERNGIPKQKDPRDPLFGYGRRKCPGQYLGDAAMWILCVNIVAAFDIRPPVKDGKFVIPPAEFEDTSICYPLPFECSMTPRSKLAESLIRD